MSSSSIGSADDIHDSKDLFTQDGVLLKAALGRPISELNSIGMLCIVQSPDGSKCIEWRPNDIITVESDAQDQEWAVVNTVGRRQRTLSGNITADYATLRARIIKIPLEELKSFRLTRNNQQLQFSIKQGLWHTTLYFQHGNAEIFVANLKSFVKTAKMGYYDRNTCVVVKPNAESQVLNRSFAELDIFTENTTDVVWNFVTNLKERPYETALGAFSKIGELVYYGNEGSVNDKRDMSEEVADLLSKEEVTSYSKNGDYEVVTLKALPPRPIIPRGLPLSTEKWEGLQDSNGRIAEVDGIKQLIFRGGIAHSIRPIVWKYLLDYYPWEMSRKELLLHQKKKKEEYFSMKLQWRSISTKQEDRFSEYRDRKSLVEKDVNRTDRVHPYYAGDNNPNLVVLQDILMTYVMYNFDLGYVQGMSDILAPLLLLFGNEEESFWCFAGFMEKIALNFDIDQAGMKHQLLQLQQLLNFASPELAKHLEEKESGNMYFCFRWILVWFKREFSIRDIMRLWEVLWTGLPCANFHLLIAVAILDSEKETFISKDYGFTEILKHVNDLSMSLNVDEILSVAEGIYHQINTAPHLSDQLRIILGLPILNNSSSTENDHEVNASAAVNDHNGTKTEGEQHQSIILGTDSEEVMYQIGLDMSF